VSPLAQRGKLRLNARRPRSNDSTAVRRDAPQSGRDRRQAVQSVQSSSPSWHSRTSSVVGWLFSQSDVLGLDLEEGELVPHHLQRSANSEFAGEATLPLTNPPRRRLVLRGDSTACDNHVRSARANDETGETGHERTASARRFSRLRPLCPNVPGAPRAWCWAWESGSTDRTTSLAVCGDVLARLATLGCLLAQATRAHAHTDSVVATSIFRFVCSLPSCPALTTAGPMGTSQSMSQQPGQGALQTHRAIQSGALKQCLQYHQLRRRCYRQKTKHIVRVEVRR
jgi:hypothetical protein